jgi:hypothetical protein
VNEVQVVGAVEVTVTVREVLAALSPLVEPLPFAERPEAYKLRDPAADGATAVNVKDSVPPVKDLAAECTISPLSSFVPEPVAWSVPVLVDTSRPPTTAAPPVIVSVYTPLVPAARVVGPVSDTVGVAPPE